MVYGYLSPITFYFSSFSLSYTHTHIQFYDAVLHLNVAKASLSVPGDKKSKGKKGYVDKLTKGRASYYLYLLNYSYSNTHSTVLTYLAS